MNQLIKIITICYVVTVTASFLNSNTGAYFNDHSKVTGILSAGEWLEEWDKSSLKFTSQSVEVPASSNSCLPAVITATIQNGGSSMTGNTEYEVYYAEKGNPKNGAKIHTATIEPITEKQSAKLSFTVDKPGNYMFHAFQRPGHGNKYDTRDDLWTNEINVVCKVEEEKVKEVILPIENTTPEQPQVIEQQQQTVPPKEGEVTAEPIVEEEQKAVKNPNEVKVNPPGTVTPPVDRGVMTPETKDSENQDKTIIKEGS
ncbi:amyloid fiber anchoring/assembly protein TapA [Bacillus sp. BGMRC 2118]|nr:amyloid fiber anchoring/assembly protein TapA [Bacillus sp. BGMRC 2118]